MATIDSETAAVACMSSHAPVKVSIVVVSEQTSTGQKGPWIIFAVTVVGVSQHRFVGGLRPHNGTADGVPRLGWQVADRAADDHRPWRLPPNDGRLHR